MGLGGFGYAGLDGLDGWWKPAGNELELVIWDENWNDMKRARDLFMIDGHTEGSLTGYWNTM